MREGTIGIIGGMGPEATLRLFELLIEATPAWRDQDHLRILIDNNPKVPDRTAAILGKGNDPVPALIESASLLEQAGADFLLIPCNTAHYWLPKLRERVSIPFLDMVAETATAVAAHTPPLERVGLLSTTGTLRTGLYQRTLSQQGLVAVVTTSAEQEHVMTAIYGIKAGSRAPSFDVLGVARGLLARGAEGLVLGCTELSLVDEVKELGCPVFDPLVILAERAVDLAKNWDERATSALR